MTLILYNHITDDIQLHVYKTNCSFSLYINNKINNIVNWSVHQHFSLTSVLKLMLMPPWQGHEECHSSSHLHHLHVACYSRHSVNIFNQLHNYWHISNLIDFPEDLLDHWRFRADAPVTIVSIISSDKCQDIYILARNLVISARTLHLGCRSFNNTEISHIHQIQHRNVSGTQMKVTSVSGFV